MLRYHAPFLALAFLAFVLLSGCGISGPVPVKLKQTDFFVQRKTSPLAERLSLPHEQLENIDTTSIVEIVEIQPIDLSNFPPYIDILTDTDTIGGWVYMDYRTQLAWKVPEDSIRFYKRMSRQRGGELSRTVNLIRAVENRMLRVESFNKHLEVQTRDIPISSVRYLRIDRKSQALLGLKPPKGERAGETILSIGIGVFVYSPLLAIGRWTGLSGSYVERMLTIMGPAAALGLAGSAVVGLSRSDDDVYYVLLNKQH